ncbi:MAG: hypothetical protein ACRDN9_04070 [Streptosporangiaceae bacterium]
MLLHPEFGLVLIRDRQRELANRAERQRLLTVARRERRRTPSKQRGRSAHADASITTSPYPDGNLAPGGQRVEAPSR